MMQSPLPTLAMCIFYAYFSKSLAPRLMQNRKPFDLRKTLVFYNLFQTLFSTWIFYEVSIFLPLFWIGTTFQSYHSDFIKMSFHVILIFVSFCLVFTIRVVTRLQFQVPTRWLYTKRPSSKYQLQKLYWFYLKHLFNI